MSKLFGFGENFGLVDPSLFVLKIDAYMRMSGMDFELVNNFSGFRKAPKGKLPHIKDNEHIVADSFFILKYLKEKYKSPLDDHISDEQKAISSLIIKSLDENFYWCIVYTRWLRDDTWPTMKETFFGNMPFPIKYIIPFIAQKGARSAFVKQGMGRHSDEEIMNIAEDTLQSLSTLLSDKPYFFGNSPSTLDAVVYSFLAQVTIITLDNPLNHLARKFDNLVNYCGRINEQYYADNTA